MADLYFRKKIYIYSHLQDTEIFLDIRQYWLDMTGSACVENDFRGFLPKVDT